MIGQINYETETLGKRIVELTSKPYIHNIVEIGTWNGMGSTRCVLEGLSKRKDQDYNFKSYECDINRYIEAVNNNKNNLKQGRLELYLGKLVPETVITDWFNVDDLTNEQRGWLNEDIIHMQYVPNLLCTVPQNIDLLILDGGEFSTYQEWATLNHRSKYVILDDTTTHKCTKIRELMLTSPRCNVLEDNLNQRHGYMIYKNE